jgi:hypothetical protein
MKTEVWRRCRGWLGAHIRNERSRWDERAIIKQSRVLSIYNNAMKNTLLLSGLSIYLSISRSCYPYTLHTEYISRVLTGILQFSWLLPARQDSEQRQMHKSFVDVAFRCPEFPIADFQVSSNDWLSQSVPLRFSKPSWKLVALLQALEWPNNKVLQSPAFV